jgi:hypothetical protein
MRTPLSVTVHLQMSQDMYHELTKLSDLLDLSRAQILRRAFREFVGLHNLNEEMPGSVVDAPPNKVLGVPEGF